MTIGREEEAFALLKEAFPGKSIILGIDDDEDTAYVSYAGNTTSITMLLVSLVIEMAEEAAKEIDDDPERYIKVFIKTLEKGAEWKWRLQNDSES